MVPVTEANIRQHELIGRPVKVAHSSNPCQTGISGQVVNETMKTLTISDVAKDRIVQKKGACFNFTLPNGLAALVEGSSILGRPIERVKARTEAS